MAHASSVIHVQVEIELTHAAPASDQVLTPCCGKTPFELKRNDRMTNDPGLVTCPGAWMARPMTASTSDHLNALAEEAFGYAYNDNNSARAAMLNEVAIALRSVSKEMNRSRVVELRSSEDQK